MGIIKVGVIMKSNKNMVLMVGLASLICFSSSATSTDEVSSSALNVISWGFLHSLFNGIDGLNKFRKNAEETGKTLGWIFSGIRNFKDNPEENIELVLDTGLNIGQKAAKVVFFPFRCAWILLRHPVRSGQGVIGAGRTTASSFKRICNNLVQKRRQSVEIAGQLD